MVRQHHIFVVAASGRFIAESAFRSGRAVSVVDLFGDADTDAICRRSSRCIQGGSRFEPKAFCCSSLASVADHFGGVAVDEFDCDSLINTISGSVVVFGGGAENHPMLFRQSLYPEAMVAGPSPDSIKRLLKFDSIVSCCIEHKISMPQVITSGNSSIDGGQGWLKKQVRSGGGLQVEIWDGSSSVDFDSGYYLQRKVEGPTVSGCYVAAQSEGSQGAVSTRMIGVCGGYPRQAENDFRYTGSFGPALVGGPRFMELKRVGEAVASWFQLRGVFGIDFIDSAKGLMLVDINPRIPASSEILERIYRTQADNFSIVKTHLDACLCDELPEIFDGPSQFFAKRIFYRDKNAAPVDVSVSLSNRLLDHSGFTDIPAAGTVVYPGQPLLTIHVQGRDRAELEKSVAERTVSLKKILASY